MFLRGPSPARHYASCFAIIARRDGKKCHNFKLDLGPICPAYCMSAERPALLLVVNQNSQVIGLGCSRLFTNLSTIAAAHESRHDPT